jgi:hypothetical protein
MYNFGYAMLNDTQLEALTELVANKIVTDLGCGRMQLTLHLAKYADRVIAIDKESGIAAGIELPTNVSFLNKYFKDVSISGCDIAVLSWPANNQYTVYELTRLLWECPCVIYIGLNDDCTECGTPFLWEYMDEMYTRDVEIPGRNEFVVYTLRQPCLR